eukprot:1191380-Prorocentrum_minimum.AAC.2
MFNMNYTARDICLRGTSYGSLPCPPARPSAARYPYAPSAARSLRAPLSVARCPCACPAGGLPPPSRRQGGLLPPPPYRSPKITVKQPL